MESVIRSLKEADLGEADRVSRLSFGIFLGLPDPMSFFGDADYIRTRFRADPSLSLAAEEDGNFVGSNFISNWGRDDKVDQIFRHAKREAVGDS